MAVTQARRKLLLEAKAASHTYDRAYVNWLAVIVKRKLPADLAKAQRYLRECGEALLTACEAAKLNTPDLSYRRSLKLKTLTIQQRQRLAPHIVAGLTGRARQLWIDTGMNLTEQIEADAMAGRMTRYSKGINADGRRTYTAGQVARKFKVTAQEVTDAAIECDVPPRALTVADAKKVRACLKAKRSTVAKRYTLNAVAKTLNEETAFVREVAEYLGLHRHDVTMKEAKLIARYIRDEA